jgi:RNA polymerase sigma-70 factor, ECF subfamily
MHTTMTIAEAKLFDWGYNQGPMGLSRLPQSKVSRDEPDEGRREQLQLEVQWISSCQSGDPSAFKHLVERYERRAFWVAYHMVSHVEDAQDLVQEAFIRAFRAMPRFKLGNRFYTWFYQILMNQVIDFLRKRRERSDLQVEVAESIEDSQDDPMGQLLRTESSERVQQLLVKLPPRERAILILRDIEGFSAKEIAEIIHTNHATVRWWLFLARKQFRREWESRYGEEDPCA